MRRFHLSFVFCCLATLFAFSAPLLAQTPPAYPGNDTAFPASFGSADSNAGTNGSWDIEGPGVSGTPTGWNVTCTGTTKSNHTMTITVPASLPISSYGSYYASYVTGYTTSGGGYSTGYTCNFQVVAAPPTLPPAGNPAFSWQGTVAGVNTGNGNKTTTLPIVGWTQRGGMPVSIALYHNSQGPNYVAWGNKWVPSYFSYISGGASAPVLHWDNGLSYAFALNGGIYVPPAGIMDKLTYSGGVFTLTTPGNTVYTFGYVPGSAYLSSIADMDGNTLSVGHNADTTVSTVTDSTNRTLSYAYSGGHLSTVTDPLGRVWTFNYGAAGGTNSSNLWYVTLPTLNGQIYAEWFGYDSNSNITAMQTPQGSVNNQTSTFGYDTSSPPRFAWAKTRSAIRRRLLTTQTTRSLPTRTDTRRPTLILIVSYLP